VHAEARDDVNLGRVVPVGLLIVVDSLEFVRLLLVQVSHLGQHFRVGRHLGDQDIVPLQGLAPHADQLVHVSDLVDNFITVGDYSV